MKKKLIITALFLSSVILAQNNNQPSVDVTGEGIVNVVPDEVTISIRVENEGKDPKEIKQQNDNTVNNVLAFLKSMQIDSKDITTEYIRLNKNYDYNTKTYRYAANQSISVKLRDLSKYEALMNGLLNSGINRIDGIQFSSSQKSKLESEARKKAIAHAKMKASEYAQALNQSIGKAILVSEYRQGNGPQPFYKSAMVMDQSSEGQQTLAPGELEIRVEVNVRFLLN